MEEIRAEQERMKAQGEKLGGGGLEGWGVWGALKLGGIMRLEALGLPTLTPAHPHQTPSSPGTWTDFVWT